MARGIKYRTPTILQISPVTPRMEMPPTSVRCFVVMIAIIASQGRSATAGRGVGRGFCSFFEKKLRKKL